MNNPAETTLDRVFHALAHPIRRGVLEALTRRPHTVVELAQPWEVSLNAVSKHLKSLEAAGLVRRRRDGNYHRISLEAGALRDAHDWLHRYAEFWARNLESLKRSVEAE